MPYLFIKIAVDEGLSPAFVSVVARRARGRRAAARSRYRAGAAPTSLRGRFRPLAVYALVEISIPFPLIAAGEQHIDSSLAAIIIAAVPLLIAVLAIRFDAPSAPPASGWSACWSASRAWSCSSDRRRRAAPTSCSARAVLLLASLGYAAGPMMLRRHLSDLDQRAVMGVSLAIAAVFLTPLTAVGAAQRAPSPTRCSSIVVLGLFCTAAAFVVFGGLIAESARPRARDHLRQPGRRARLGIAVLGERPGAGAIAGLLLILAGSWLHRRPPAARARGRAQPRPAYSTKKSSAFGLASESRLAAFSGSVPCRIRLTGSSSTLPDSVRGTSATRHDLVRARGAASSPRGSAP